MCIEINKNKIITSSVGGGIDERHNIPMVYIAPHDDKVILFKINF